VNTGIAVYSVDERGDRGVGVQFGAAPSWVGLEASRRGVRPARELGEYPAQGEQSCTVAAAATAQNRAARPASSVAAASGAAPGSGGASWRDAAAT